MTKNIKIERCASNTDQLPTQINYHLEPQNNLEKKLSKLNHIYICTFACLSARVRGERLHQERLKQDYDFAKNVKIHSEELWTALVTAHARDMLLPSPSHWPITFKMDSLTNAQRNATKTIVFTARSAQMI